MIYDEEVGRVACVGRVNIYPKRMEIMTLWIVLQGQALRLSGFSSLGFCRYIHPQSTMGIRIAQRAHDGVPCFTTRITADEYATFL
jgi:hypothetical protein